MHSIYIRLRVGHVLEVELKVLPTNTQLLRSVAAASGGKFEVSAEDVFEPIPGKSASASRALTSILLLAAMMIYVADLVIRRVVLSAA